MGDVWGGREGGREGKKEGGRVEWIDEEEVLEDVWEGGGRERESERVRE